MKAVPVRPCVLVFAGLDPSGGAGIAADIEAIGANGAHALPIVTVLTVQDNERVQGAHPVDAALLERQALALIARTPVAAVKIGALGNQANARRIASLVHRLRQNRPDLPVVLDPVLASGHGDRLGDGDPLGTVRMVLEVATVVTPNLPEAARLSGFADAGERQRRALQSLAPHILLKGGHAGGAEVINLWLHGDRRREWRWPRLAGAWHGSGCTLAAALAARLARGAVMAAALDAAQVYCQAALGAAYRITDGQLIPQRRMSIEGNIA